jgi:hypothetical protein
VYPRITDASCEQALAAWQKMEGIGVSELNLDHGLVDPDDQHVTHVQVRGALFRLGYGRKVRVVRAGADVLQQFEGDDGSEDATRPGQGVVGTASQLEVIKAFAVADHPVLVVRSPARQSPALVMPSMKASYALGPVAMFAPRITDLLV